MRQQELRKEEEESAKVSDFFKPSLRPLFVGGMTHIRASSGYYSWVWPR